MLDSLLSSTLFAAVVGGVLTGIFSIAATWWTLTATFRTQAETNEEAQRRRERAAGWALITEMGENLARCRALANLAKSEAPVTNMRENLKLNRYVFETQLPLIALPLGLEDLRTVAAAYAAMSNLFGILEGKWRSQTQVPATKTDIGSLNLLTDDYEVALRTAGKAILTAEELRIAGLEEASK